jgi:hypothetical protein
MANPLPGYHIDFEIPSTYRHYLGGSNELQGAVCVNCVKPCMRHLTLDLCDPALQCLPFELSELVLLYCSRCALCWRPFYYQQTSESHIEVVEANLGETTWEDWYSDIGVDEFKIVPFSLRGIPAEIQDAYERHRIEGKLRKEEEEMIGQFFGSYADQNVGGYPIVTAVNQVGGNTFLYQRLDPPPCVVCAKNRSDCVMEFLASLTNDPVHDVRISFDGVQIIFYVCHTCGTICVMHSC